MCVCACVCGCVFVFAFMRQHWTALKLYKKSEFVVAERGLLCRNTNVLSSFQARESRQCLCVCLCVAFVFVCVCVFAFVFVCACDISRHIGTLLAGVQESRRF